MQKALVSPAIICCQAHGDQFKESDLKQVESSQAVHKFSSKIHERCANTTHEVNSLEILTPLRQAKSQTHNDMPRWYKNNADHSET
jgi:hypothetical protein